MKETDASADPPPEVVEAFASAAITALQELTRLEAVIEELPAVVAVDRSNVIAATVCLMRPIPGMMILVLTEESAIQLAARYLPQGTLLTEEIVDDVAGEIANVIAGQAKTILKGTLYHYLLSTPVVARRASFGQIPGIAEARLVASLTFEAGGLLLLVRLSPCPGA